jgi:uncharacterized metal-binding protein YceD (DUF177 family)
VAYTVSAGHGFKRMVAAAKIGDGGLVHAVKAQPAEFADIAAYLELAGVKSLTGEIALERWRGKGVRLSGKLTADVVQTCVVTLDPVEAHVEAAFERRFLQPEKLLKEAEDESDVFVDPTGEDPPEPLSHEIDLGEILIEELALNLDPYPRKPGVAFQGDATSEPRENPFAVLAKLKPKKG